MTPKNYLEDLTNPEVLAFLFLSQAERRRILVDGALTPEVLAAYEAYLDTFRPRLASLPEDKTRYLLTFSHPQSSEEIDPYDEDQVRRLRERFDPLIRRLVEHRTLP
jgi:hypothetical protein